MNSLLSFIHRLFYIEDSYMRPEEIKYNLHMEAIQCKIDSTRDQIQDRIEGACRVCTSIEVIDLGFQETSSVLFEGSWQEKVVNSLEMDGYLCIMTFDYTNGKPLNTLKVSWGK